VPQPFQYPLWSCRFCSATYFSVISLNISNILTRLKITSVISKNDLRSDQDHRLKIDQIIFKKCHFQTKFILDQDHAKFDQCIDLRSSKVHPSHIKQWNLHNVSCAWHQEKTTPDIV
jgi:hypothetical protein